MNAETYLRIAKQRYIDFAKRDSSLPTWDELSQDRKNALIANVRMQYGANNRQGYDDFTYLNNSETLVGPDGNVTKIPAGSPSFVRGMETHDQFNMQAMPQSWSDWLQSLFPFGGGGGGDTIITDNSTTNNLSLIHI